MSETRETCECCGNLTFYIESFDGELTTRCTECSHTTIYEPDLYKRPSKLQLDKYKKMFGKIKAIIEAGP